MLGDCDSSESNHSDSQEYAQWLKYTHFKIHLLNLQMRSMRRKGTMSPRHISFEELHNGTKTTLVENSTLRVSQCDFIEEAIENAANVGAVI